MIKNISNESCLLTVVEVENKESLHLISEKYDCFINSANPNEIILDISNLGIDGDEDYQNVVDFFGLENWNNFSGGMVLFHI